MLVNSHYVHLAEVLAHHFFVQIQLVILGEAQIVQVLVVNWDHYGFVHRKRKEPAEKAGHRRPQPSLLHEAVDGWLLLAEQDAVGDQGREEEGYGAREVMFLVEAV